MNYTFLAIIRRDRDSFGGGVAVYIDEHLQFNHINMEALSDIEVFLLEFTPKRSKKILFSSLHRPPNFDAPVFWQEVETLLVNY